MEVAVALPLEYVGVPGGEQVVGYALEEVAEHEVGEEAHDGAGEQACGYAKVGGGAPLEGQVAGGEILPPHEGAEAGGDGGDVARAALGEAYVAVGGVAVVVWIDHCGVVRCG